MCSFVQFLVQQEYIFYCIPYRSQKQKFCSLFALKILIMKKASISKPARRIVSNAGYISCSFNNDYGNDKNNMKCCHQFGTSTTAIYHLRIFQKWYKVGQCICVYSRRAARGAPLLYQIHLHYIFLFAGRYITIWSLIALHENHYDHTNEGNHRNTDL